MTELSLFLNGERPNLDQVLKTREQRALFEETVCQKHLGRTLLALTCNIPGPIKNNATIERLFDVGKEELLTLCSKQNWEIVYEKTVLMPTGPEYFVVFDENPEVVKWAAIRLEDSSPLGRLWNMDSFYYNQGETATVSRKELNLLPRKCLICKQTAKSCGRNRTHTVDELLNKIEEIILADDRIVLN